MSKALTRQNLQGLIPDHVNDDKTLKVFYSSDATAYLYLIRANVFDPLEEGLLPSKSMRMILS